MLRHLRALTEEGELDRWSYKYARIEQVFSKIFIFLQDNYSLLSPKVCNGLSNRAIVPVGTTLVKGNRIFFRLDKDLAPLFFELPRGKLSRLIVRSFLIPSIVFGACDTFLHNIGVKDSPTQEDYALLLHELKSELGDSKLNVNELNSIVDILQLIVDNQLSYTSFSTNSLHAPNMHGVLIELDSLLQNDCPRLVNTNRLNLEVCHLAHPKLPNTVCKNLGMCKFSIDIQSSNVNYFLIILLFLIVIFRNKPAQ